MNVNPQACFDALAIVASMDEHGREPVESEVHLLAYLSCLLSLYQGHAVSDWGYDIASTEGQPFAAALHEGLHLELHRGHAVCDDTGVLRATPAGVAALASLSRLHLGSRLKFIEGACGAALSLPRGLLRNALAQDPELGPAVALGSSRLLLQGTGVPEMHRQFGEIRTVVPPGGDGVLLPGVVWLAFYNELANAADCGDAADLQESGGTK